jgi:4-amino-4-deoxy-L-arabinose transferase-like glycosyltransferase
LRTHNLTAARPNVFARITRGWRASSLAILTAIWALTQLWGIFSPPLMDDADSVHSEAVREMVLRHDYVTLYADGIRYFDKPPLPYWLSAASVHIFGMYDWAIRLPLAITMLLLTLYLYQLANRLVSGQHGGALGEKLGERAGFYSALVFATSIGPYLFTRFFIPDVMVAFWLVIAVDLILRMENSVLHYGRAKLWQAAAFGLVCAGCTLTKGLIGIVFPVGILFAYLLVTGQLRLFFRMRPFTGTAVFAIAAVPWHWLAAVRNPAIAGVERGWFWFYFINDQYYRFLDKRIPRDYDKVPLGIFYLLLLVWLMPWVVWLPAALRRGWMTARHRAFMVRQHLTARAHELRDRETRQAEGFDTPHADLEQEAPTRLTWRQRTASPQTLFFLWALVILLFFSFSTRQEYYTIPAVPALALLTGFFLAREEQGELHTDRPGLFAAAALMLIGCATAAICLYFGLTAPPPPPGMDIFRALHQDPSHYALSFGHFFDLTRESLGFFHWPLLGTAVGLFIGTAQAFAFRLRRRYYAANVILAASMVLVLGCAHWGLRVFYPILGSEPLAQVINHNWQPATAPVIVIDGEYTNASALNFYTGQPVMMLNGRINGLWYGSLFPDAPHRFEDDSSFAVLWTSPRQIFFVSDREPNVKRWLAASPTAHILAESGGKWLLVNH